MNTLSDGVSVEDKVARCAIFVSHANPEDNAFTLWLGAKLSALGYEVWADILRLKGGDDWQRKLERALRDRACKVLFVANAHAVEKQGVRNEIQIAAEVAKRIGDHEFIIPLRLGSFEAPFLIAQAQYIDFQKGWMKGLAELLSTLDDTYHLPKSGDVSGSLWRDVQLLHAKELEQVPEQLISNWLRIEATPETIRCYNFQSGIFIDRAQARIRDAPWPLSPFRRGFLSFAPLHDLQDHFGPNFPLLLDADLDMGMFLDSGWPELQITQLDARKCFSDLGRQAIEKLFETKGLAAYELSGHQKAWWAPLGVGPEGKVAFQWGQFAGLRQIQGVSKKRSLRWHFGVSFAVRSSPIQHVRLFSRLIFTSDGQEPFDNAKRMHRVRRSFAKSWRNARWRDMLLAFLHWLSNGQPALRASVSSAEDLILGLPPISWTAPVSIPPGDETTEPDLDDPSDDEETWPDHDFEYGESAEDDI